MVDMTTFIARRIMEQADKNLEAGQNKYRAYFVKVKIYEKLKRCRIHPYYRWVRGLHCKIIKQICRRTIWQSETDRRGLFLMRK